MSDDLRESLRASLREANESTGGDDVAPTEDVAASPDVDAGEGRSAGDVSGTVPSVDPTGGAARGDDTQASETPAPSRARDATGKFAKATKTATEAPKAPAKAEQSVTPVPKAATEEPSQTPAPQPGAQSVALKPPQSWKPAVREKWATLPPEVQAEVVRDNLAAQRALNESSSGRRALESLQSVAAPYEQHLRQSGVDFVHAAGASLQAMLALEHGTPQQKAESLAKMFRAANVDADAFIAAVEGGAAPRPEHQQLEATVMANVLQRLGLDPAAAQQLPPGGLMQHVRRDVQTEMYRENATRELQTWSSTAEFLDVGPAEDGSAPSMRELMAGLISTRVARGYADAYDKACKLHPDVAPYLAQREAAKAATAQQAATHRARAASLSVKSEPTVDRPPPAADDIRGALRQSFAEARGNRR